MKSNQGRIDRETGPAGRKDFRAFLQTRAFGICIALTSLLFLLLYVFGLTDYRSLFYGDMQGFWMRAMERLYGNPFQITQYLAWPPGYHIFLAEFFRLLQWVGLTGLIRPETALAINLIAFSVSVYALQRISVRWFTKPQWILIVLVLYGFGFPAWYFNAFLISENLALPLFIAAVAFLYCRESWTSLIISAVLFAFAAVIRPSIAPYGLAFVIFCFVRWRISWSFVARSAVFSVVFFALILGAGAEVSRISQGKVKGLSANGGLDFFIANSRYYRIDLNYEGWHNFIVVPAVSGNPENGFFKTSIPYYDQDYYFKLGWGFIKHDPSRLIKNVGHVRDLFFARMMPSAPTPGYNFALPVWDGFKFFMFVALGLYIWLWRGLARDELPLFGFMGSVIGLTVLVSYLFTGEPRYTYSIIFIFYLLFFKLAELMTGNWQRWKKVWLPFALVLGLCIGVTLAAAAMMKPHFPPSIRMQAVSPEGKTAVVQDVGRLYFPFDFQAMARHGDTGYKPDSPSRIFARTDLEITGPDPLPLKFDICSVWPYAIYIDGRLLIEDKDPFYPSPDKLAVFDPGSYLEQNAQVTLAPGRHTLEIVFDYSHREGGFTICYSYPDSENWPHRNMFGVSDEKVRFHLPREVNGP